MRAYASHLPLDSNKSITQDDRITLEELPAILSSISHTVKAYASHLPIAFTISIVLRLTLNTIPNNKRNHTNDSHNVNRNHPVP